MATKYGAKAWTGINTIGPSKNFVSPLGINPATAKDHPVNVTELTKVLSESPGSGRLVSVPEGITITVPNTSYGKTVKSGFVLAGPGNIKWNYYGPASGYMLPLINLQDGAVLSGVGLEGGGGYGHYGQGAGPCAVRASGRRQIIIENVDLTKFRGGGVWFGDGAASITRWDDDSQRNILRNVKISHVQQYGFGYGCGLQGSNQSFLIEASILEDCRHLTMSSGGTTTAYELRYCIFGDAVYANSDSGPASIQSHQVDAHGGGWLRQSYRCGKILYVHHCDFSSNDQFSPKPNVCIRGLMAPGGWAVIEWCYTKKASHTGVFTQTDRGSNNALVMLAEEEGAPWEGPNNLISAGVTCRNNFYGVTPPSDDEEPPDIPVADIQITELLAPTVQIGSTYEVRATVQNKGTVAGKATVTIGWINASGSKIPLEIKDVDLGPGIIESISQFAKATTVGNWKFYCQVFNVYVTTTLTVTDISAPVFELSNAVSIVSATVKNTGTAPGTVGVSLTGDAEGSKDITLAVGQSEKVSFSIGMVLEKRQ